MLIVFARLASYQYGDYFRGNGKPSNNCALIAERSYARGFEWIGTAKFRVSYLQSFYVMVCKF